MRRCTRSSDAVKEIGAKRVVLDSLVGFEMALAPDFRHEFRESLYRMIGALTRLGVTIVSTVEVEESFTSMGLSATSPSRSSPTTSCGCATFRSTGNCARCCWW